MAAMVLYSQRAMEISVYVVRAFVKLRESLSANKELAVKLVELERKLDTHDQAIAGILKAIRQLMNPPGRKRRGIGFTADEPSSGIWTEISLYGHAIVHVLASSGRDLPIASRDNRYPYADLKCFLASPGSE